MAITRPLTRAGSKAIATRCLKNQRDFRPYSAERGDEWPSLFNPTMCEWRGPGALAVPDLTTVEGGFMLLQNERLNESRDETSHGSLQRSALFVKHQISKFFRVTR